MADNCIPDLLDFLALPQPTPVLKSTAQALKFSLGKRLTPQELSQSIPLARELLLDGDPLFGSGAAGIDMELVYKFAPKAERLSLAHQRVVNCHYLAEFKNLRALNLNSARLDDQDFFYRLNPLEELCWAKPQIIEPSILENLSLQGLRKADFSGWDLKEVAFLAKSQNIEVLALNDNHIASGSFLVNLQNIRELRLDNNLLNDIDFCRKLRNLKKFSFVGNRVFDLEPLQDCYGLTELYFAKNSVRSLKPLSGLRDLYRVSCAGNPLTEDDFDVIPRSIRLD